MLRTRRRGLVRLGDDAGGVWCAWLCAVYGVHCECLRARSDPMCAVVACRWASLPPGPSDSPSRSPPPRSPQAAAEGNAPARPLPAVTLCLACVASHKSLASPPTSCLEAHSGRAMPAQRVALEEPLGGRSDPAVVRLAILSVWCRSAPPPPAGHFSLLGRSPCALPKPPTPPRPRPEVRVKTLVSGVVHEFGVGARDIKPAGGVYELKCKSCNHELQVKVQPALGLLNLLKPPPYLNAEELGTPGGSGHTQGRPGWKQVASRRGGRPNVWSELVSHSFVASINILRHGPLLKLGAGPG